MLYQLTVLLAIRDEIDLLPADASRHNTKRLVTDFVLLVEHQEIRRPSLSFESVLAMLDSPLELLGGDQDLAENGIDSGLATVQARCPNDRVLVVKQKPTTSVQHMWPPVK